MTIVFHCEHCGKKIEAPDSASGKRGKCPRCHNKVHVPGLDTDNELTLEPIDENDSKRQRELMAEMRIVEQNILSERETPDSPVEVEASTPEVSDKELTKNIIVYLRQMADGDLEQADRISNSIVPYGSKALKILDEIALSELPEPELADIPQQALSGLIRNLRTQIS